MMPDSDPQKRGCSTGLNRWRHSLRKRLSAGKVDVATGKRRVKDRSVFCRHAALYKTAMRRPFSASACDNFPGSDAYYSYVLTLFGQGWDQHRFRFSTKGELLPDWGRNAQIPLNIFTLSLGLCRHADGRGSTNRSATVAGASSVRRSDPS